MIWVFVALVLLVAAGACHGAAWYLENRERIKLAVGVLRGHLKIEQKKDSNGGETFSVSCARPHAETGNVVLKQSEHDALVRNSNELTLALGYIARCEKRDYGVAVSTVIDKQ